MVKIPDYERRISDLPGGSNIPHATADTFGAQIGRAQEKLGHAIGSVLSSLADGLASAQNEQDALTGKIELNAHENRVRLHEANLWANTPPENYASIPGQVREFETRSRADAMTRISPRYHGVFNKNATIFGNNAVTRSQIEVVKNQATIVERRLDSAIAGQSSAIIAQPGYLDDAIYATRQLIEETNIPAHIQNAWKVKYGAQLAASVIEGYIKAGDFKTAHEWKTRAIDHVMSRLGAVPLHEAAPIPSKSSYTPDQRSSMERVIRIAQEAGIPIPQALAYTHIESSFKPNQVTGSYKGLLQLSDAEFAKYGGTGNIFDPESNLRAGFASLKDKGMAFYQRHGRIPDALDLYMQHQQGEAGYAAHLARPAEPAWKNMLSTGEGRQKGEAWAKAAIWKNIPDQDKARFGGVENVTSKQFVDYWRERVDALLARYKNGIPTMASAKASDAGSKYYSLADLRNDRGDKTAGVTMEPRIIKVLDAVTDDMGRKLTVTSAARSPAYNQQVSWSGEHGPHTRGSAIDVSTAGLSDADKTKLIASAISHGATAIGTYDNNSIHLEVRDGTGKGPNGLFAWHGRTGGFDSMPPWAQSGIKIGAANPQPLAVAQDVSAAAIVKTAQTGMSVPTGGQWFAKTEAGIKWYDAMERRISHAETVAKQQNEIAVKEANRDLNDERAAMLKHGAFGQNPKYTPEYLSKIFPPDIAARIQAQRAYDIEVHREISQWPNLNPEAREASYKKLDPALRAPGPGFDYMVDTHKKIGEYMTKIDAAEERAVKRLDHAKVQELVILESKGQLNMAEVNKRARHLSPTLYNHYQQIIINQDNVKQDDTETLLKLETDAYTAEPGDFTKDLQAAVRDKLIKKSTWSRLLAINMRTDKKDSIYNFIKEQVTPPPFMREVAGDIYRSKLANALAEWQLFKERPDFRDISKADRWRTAMDIVARSKHLSASQAAQAFSGSHYLPNIDINKVEQKDIDAAYARLASDLQFGSITEGQAAFETNRVRAMEAYVKWKTPAPSNAPPGRQPTGTQTNQPKPGERQPAQPGQQSQIPPTPGSNQAAAAATVPALSYMGMPSMLMRAAPAVLAPGVAAQPQEPKEHIPEQDFSDYQSSVQPPNLDTPVDELEKYMLNRWGQ